MYMFSEMKNPIKQFYQQLCMLMNRFSPFSSELPKRQICRWRNHSAIHKIPASNGSSIYIPIDPPFNERKLNYTSRNKWTNWRRLKQITRKSYVWRYLTVSQNKFPNTARINPSPRCRFSSRNSFSFNLVIHRFWTIGCHWNFSDWFFWPLQGGGSEIR